MFPNKKMTRLLDAKFRRRILFGMSERRAKEMMIGEYAAAVVAECAKSRDMSYSEDKSAYYGFSPVYFLCAVRKDGTVDKKLFEFKVVNHFIRSGEMEEARETVRCMLTAWAAEDKGVLNFDPERIEAEMKRIEAEYSGKGGEADAEVDGGAVQA